MIIGVLENVGNQAFPAAYGLSSEFFAVPVPDGVCPWSQVGEGPEYENPGGGRLGKEGKTGPFYQLAEIIP